MSRTMIGLASFALALGASAAAHATATVTVNALTSTAGDHKCGVEEAISTLNGSMLVDGCTISGTFPVNRISIPSNAGTYLTSHVNVAITRSVTIAGGGMSSTTIQLGGASSTTTGLRVSGTSVQVTFQNLTLKGANSNQLTGVTNANAHVTLSSVRLTNFGYAALVNSSNATPSPAMTVTGSTITSNGIYGSLPLGGGILNQGTLTVTGSTISNNFAETGGGIANLANGLVTVTSSTITSNTAIDFGGGIYTAQAPPGNTSFSLTMQNSNVLSNDADLGGGVYIDTNGSQASIMTSNLNSNFAATNGGALWVGSGAFVTLERNLFASNQAGGNGGALYSNGEENEVDNCTFSFNTADSGGAIYHVDASEFHMQHSTVAFNTANSEAGGLHVELSGPIFRYNIVADNSAPSFNDVHFVSGGPVAIAFKCLVTDVTGMEDFVPASDNLVGVDPILGPLQSMGGNTQVQPLLTGSPAINYIPTTVGDPFTVDQRGRTRPSGSGFDIGAYERQPNDAPHGWN